MKIHKIIIYLASLLAVITILFSWENIVLRLLGAGKQEVRPDIKKEAYSILRESGYGISKNSSFYYSDSIIVYAKGCSYYPHWVDTFYILNRRNKEITIIDNIESFYEYIKDSLHIADKYDLLSVKVSIKD